MSSIETCLASGPINMPVNQWLPTAAPQAADRRDGGASAPRSRGNSDGSGGIISFIEPLQSDEDDAPFKLESSHKAESGVVEPPTAGASAGGSETVTITVDELRTIRALVVACVEGLACISEALDAARAGGHRSGGGGAPSVKGAAKPATSAAGLNERYAHLERWSFSSAPERDNAEAGRPEDLPSTSDKTPPARDLDTSPPTPNEEAAPLPDPSASMQDGLDAIAATVQRVVDSLREFPIETILEGIPTSGGLPQSLQRFMEAAAPNRARLLSFEEEMDFERRKSTALVRTLIKETGGDGFKVLNGRYTVLKELGRGSFGKVKLAAVGDTSELRAIKVIPRRLLRGKYRMDGSAGDAGAQFMREVEVMKKLKHRNIVKLHEVIDDPAAEKLYLVMQYVERGPIVQLDRHGRCPALDLEVARGYMRQIASAVAYMHHRRVCHRDIKPDNILLGSNGLAYLADFGVSSMLGEEGADSFGSGGAGGGATAGTPAFWAPECFDETRSELDHFAVDVWALGMTFFVMAFGQLPFDCDGSIACLKHRITAFDSVAQVKAAVTESEFTQLSSPAATPQDVEFKSIASTSFTSSFGASATNLDFLMTTATLRERLSDLLVRMLDRSPANRPSIRAVHRHKFFTDPLASSDRFSASPHSPMTPGARLRTFSRNENSAPAWLPPVSAVGAAESGRNAQLGPSGLSSSPPPEGVAADTRTSTRAGAVRTEASPVPPVTLGAEPVRAETLEVALSIHGYEAPASVLAAGVVPSPRGSSGADKSGGAHEFDTLRNAFTPEESQSNVAGTPSSSDFVAGTPEHPQVLQGRLRPSMRRGSLSNSLSNAAGTFGSLLRAADNDNDNDDNDALAVTSLESVGDPQNANESASPCAHLFQPSQPPHLQPDNAGAASVQTATSARDLSGPSRRAPLPPTPLQGAGDSGGCDAAVTTSPVLYARACRGRGPAPLQLPGTTLTRLGQHGLPVVRSPSHTSPHAQSSSCLRGQRDPGLAPAPAPQTPSGKASRPDC